MNRESTRKYRLWCEEHIPVMKAFEGGKQIQSAGLSGDGWGNNGNPNWVCSARYRVKPETVDWRVGMTVQGKYKRGLYYLVAGTVKGVFPSGTACITDENGVLAVLLHGSGAIVLTGADEWMTA